MHLPPPSRDPGYVDGFLPVKDGPTDATGAFLTDSDIFADGSSMDASKLATFLNSKCSYLFWSEYIEGHNLVKIGKTGVNMMDVQMLAMDFGK